MVKIEDFKGVIKDIKDTGKIRPWLAILIIAGFFFLLIYAMALNNFGINTVAETTDLLKTIGAILGGIIGAVITFYFSKNN